MLFKKVEEQKQANPQYINNMLGVELASSFWHFVDILWICLFLFLYFFK
ncbi:cytochrome c oxidase subunit 3 [Winogradskyella sp.]